MRSGAMLACFLVALGLRAWAARGDLWLDEIWSWYNIRAQVDSVDDLFLVVRHDNNHLLNSLWMYACGLDVAGYWYRVPAVVAGALSIPFAMRFAARDSTAAGWIAAALMVPSSLLVHYGSEARGYGVMIACVVIGLWLLEAIPRAATRTAHSAMLIAWWTVAMLGWLAHASFAFAFAACVAWQAEHLRRTAPAFGSALRTLLTLFAPPGLFALALWIVNYGQQIIGGGPPETAWHAASTVAALALGAPGEAAWTQGVGAAIMVVVLIEAVLARRAGDARWALWIAALAVPALPLILGLHAQAVYPRYFLGCVAIALIALATLLARLWRTDGAPRMLAGGALLLITLGNLGGLARLYLDARGAPQAALRWVATHSRDADVVLDTQRHALLGMTLGYYQGVLDARQRLVIRPVATHTAASAEWYVELDQSSRYVPALMLTGDADQPYRLEAFYPTAGLSGFGIALYHRENSTPTR